MIRTENLIHPGEILAEEFLKPMNISQNKLAMDIHVPTPRINAIVKGSRAITADTALRLGKYFGTVRSSGSIFRPITISVSRRHNQKRKSPLFHNWLLPDCFCPLDRFSAYFCRKNRQKITF